MFASGCADYASFTAPTSDNLNLNIRAAFARAREIVGNRTFRQEGMAVFVGDGGQVFRFVCEAATAAVQHISCDGHTYVSGRD